MLRLAYSSKFAVQVPQPMQQPIIVLTIVPMTNLLMSVLALQAFDGSVFVKVLRIHRTARTVHLPHNASNFFSKAIACFRYSGRCKYTEVTNIFTAKRDSLRADVYTDATLLNEMFCDPVTVAFDGWIAFQNKLSVILPFGAYPRTNNAAILYTAF